MIRSDPNHPLQVAKWLFGVFREGII